MKKKIITILPFVTIPVYLPIHRILDSLFLVDVFGCGCVPSTQTNMLGIPFNANDLRVTVFVLLALLLSLWSFRLSKTFRKRVVRIVYCAAAVLANIGFAIWAANAYMWA